MAQTLYLPINRVFTNLGAIGAGFKLHTYEAESVDTDLATYSDTALSIANSNPIIADSAGRFVQIFVDDPKLYKLVLKDADDNTIWTADPADPKIFSLNDFDPRPTSFWGTTGGSSTVYTLVANPIISAYSSTQTFFLEFHVACGASPTLTYVSGGAALSLKKSDGVGGKTNLEANDVRTGTYEARNDGTDIIILNPEIQEVVKANSLIIPVNAALTIASGVITITDSQHSIRSEVASNSDILVTINGGVAGKMLTLFLGASDEPITFDSGAGNIICPNGFDITAANVNQRLRLQYDGSNWIFLDIKLPGDIVQVVPIASFGAVSTGVVLIPDDDTPPQNDEGDQVMSSAITPTNASNKLEITMSAFFQMSNCNLGLSAIFQDSTASAVGAGRTQVVSGAATHHSYTIIIPAGTISETTIKVRIGSNLGSNTTTFNGTTSSRKLGGVMSSTLTIREIQV